MKISIEQTYPQQAHYDWLLVPLLTKNLESVLGKFLKEKTGSATFPVTDFSGEAGEKWIIHPSGKKIPAKRIAFLGLGENAQPGGMRKAIRSFVHHQHKKLSATLAIDLQLLSRQSGKKMANIAGCVQEAAEGASLGQYQIDKYKTGENAPNLGPKKIKKLLFLTTAPKGELIAAGVSGIQIAAAQKLAMDIVNLPGNKMTAKNLAKTAASAGKANGFSVKIMNRKQILETGLHALLAVNQGSVAPPRFIIMDYQPKVSGKKHPVVGLVGKGVTFDTGGISLKRSTNLHLLKSDKGGAAAVIGAVDAAARLALPMRVIGIVPATDNMPDGAAMNPGDIIDTYSGLTVEVEDTDAEGRLILADGLAYLKKHFQPDVMIDLATLTGASVISLGKHAGALFSNNDKLATDLSAAGFAADERVWRLPLWDDYGAQIASDMADVKNYGGPAAGAITAAKFLEKFIDKHPAWAHLDIPGVALEQSEFAKGRSASGFGVRLIVQYLMRLAAGL